MRLYTDALDPSGYFDPRYTCDIDNSSPELRWEAQPEITAAFALLFEDIDASDKGAFIHWVVYNIPRNVSHLPAGIPPQDSLPNGIRQGINGFGKLGYVGPCPPKGHGAHRYVFRLMALREIPAFPAKLTGDQLLTAIRDHVIETSEIQGKYTRAIEKAG